MSTDFATSSTDFSPATIPDPSSLKKTASDISQERRNKFHKAYDLAIAEIVKDAGTKMKSDAENGRFRTILYTFYTNDAKDADKDKNGQMIRFGDVYLRDMITKGHIPFFTKLTNHFNTEAKSSEYHCSFFRHKESDESVSYNIYVSWGNSRPVQHRLPHPPHVHPHPPHSNQSRGGRGGRGGRGSGGRGGRGAGGRGDGV
jgi:hypothetical protein